MPDEKNLSMVPSENGNVDFAPDVIATIAGLAAMSVDGVSGMSGGMADGIVDLLGLKNLTKGVKVDLGREETIVNASIVVRYGLQIHKVCEAVQAAIKNAVETMTGLKAVAINIYVQGISFDEEEAKSKKSKDSKERPEPIKLR